METELPILHPLMSVAGEELSAEQRLETIEKTILFNQVAANDLTWCQLYMELAKAFPDNQQIQAIITLQYMMYVGLLRKDGFISSELVIHDLAEFMLPLAEDELAKHLLRNYQTARQNAELPL